MTDTIKSRGNKYYAEKKYNRAISCYSTCIEREPANQTYYSNRAAAYYMIGDYEKALVDCENAIEIDKNFVKAMTRKAKCLTNLGHLEEASKAYKGLVEIDPTFMSILNSEMNQLDDVIKRSKVAETEIEAKQYHKAIESLKYCLERSTASKQFKILLAVYYAYTNNCLYRDTIKNVLNEEDVKYKYITSIYMIASGDEVTASRFLTNALKKDADDENLRKLYKSLLSYKKIKEEATTLFKNQDFEKAIEIYINLLQEPVITSKLMATLYNNIATCYSKMERNDDCIKFATLAIMADETYTKALFRRAKSYQDNDQHEMAVKDYQTIVAKEKTPENMNFLNHAKSLLKKCSSKDLYKVLGVSKTSEQNEIKKAYRKLALSHHPDRHSGDEPHIKEKHEQLFKKVNEAYSVLSDPEKRARYDRGGDLNSMNFGSSGGIDASEVINMFFGHGAPSASRSRRHPNTENIFSQFSGGSSNGQVFRFNMN